MIVTRFAPSPTGYLHVGGARTALFNWLLARRTGGKFLLRIEDTDMKRNTPTAMRQVMEDLRWLGIEWDEGPEVGGPHGPYLQSERRAIYDKYIRQLLDAGKAYYSFDTAEELDAARKLAETEKRSNIYRRPAVCPTEADVEKARAEGRPVTVRFAVTATEPIVVHDEIRGDVSFDPAEIGDFIILKSDGFPTYHFAVVVDDELMGVTHVIRGQEHLMNTPNHQLLQRALGFRIPTYAHMSVTVSESGGKLSKREQPKAVQKYMKEHGVIPYAALTAKIGADELEAFRSGHNDALNKVQMQDLTKFYSVKGSNVDELRGKMSAGLEIVRQLVDGRIITESELVDFLEGNSVPDIPIIEKIAEHLGIRLPEINVVDFFRSGYLPEAMVNFLALLGWNPGDGREIMSRQELVEAFDLSRVNKSNSLFDRDKLLAFNTEHIKRTPMPTLVGHFRRYLAAIESPVAKADDTLLEAIIRMNEGARTLEQIEQKTRFAFVSNDQVRYDAEAVKKVLQKGDGLAMLRAVREALAGLQELTPEGIESLLRNLAQAQKVGLGKIAQPLRVAICGTTISPPIFNAVDLLGIDNTLKRIDIALKHFA
ncbi:MAG: glutamate--tRNA ligase [Planctomycetaceae bacterium]|nr:glutamate--tRNA ligase [Planctomycetaceae bacterium]